jgi:hypothetical protein
VVGAKKAMIIVRIRHAMTTKNALRIAVTIMVVVYLLCQREWEML